MTSSGKTLVRRRLFALALALTSGVCSAESAPDAVCGVAFDAAKNGFSLRPPQPDETNGCGRFLEPTEPGGSDGLLVSLVVLPGPASHALKTVPSNFFVTANSSIRFKRPRPVNDSKFFYFVRPLGTLYEKRLPVTDGTIYIAEHKRRVDRLKKINDREEQEVTELQRCVDAVRTSASVTVVLSGCGLAKTGSNLSKRMLTLLQSAQLPATSIEPPKK